MGGSARWRRQPMTRSVWPSIRSERAVDVAGGVTEQQVHQQLPAERVELAHGRVGPMASPANDQVGLAVHRRQEVLQLGNVELLVAVGQEDQVLVGGVEAARERRAIPAITFVSDDA